MKRLNLYLLAICTPLLLACSDEPASAGMGPLTPVIQEMSDDAWSVRKDNGTVVMTNQGEPGAIRYFYVQPGAGEEGNREISVDVSLLESAPESLAGLLYGYQENPKSYYLFTVRGDGLVSLHAMDNGNFQERMAFSLGAPITAKTTLTIRERGSEIGLLVNGVEKSSLGNNRLGRGAVGIVASHLGSYQFDNFAVRLDGKNTAIAASSEPSASAAPGRFAATSNQTIRSTPAAQNAQQAQTKYFYSPDPSSGMSSGRIPLPSNWTQLKNNKEFLFEGPNRVRVSTTGGGTFQFTNDRDMAQIFQSQGTTNQPPMSIEEITQKFYMPVAKQTGRQLVKTYELPELARKSLEQVSQVYSSMPQQLEAKSYALEWKDDKGMSYVSIVNINIARSHPSSYWMLMSQYLEAPHEHFPAARDALLKGLTNAETNPEWLARNNQRDEQRARVSNRQHIGRMDDIRRAGDAALQVGKTYSEISDSSHQGYMERNRIRDAGHERTINAIGDRTIIANPDTGQRYNVESGSDQYWVDPNEGYFGSDNPNYDPRTDQNMNQRDWVQYREVR